MLLSDLVFQGAQAYPDRPALIFRDQTITYSDLARGVHGCAAGLKALGIGERDRISLLLPNCPPFIFGYYAAGLLGAVAVPVNPLLKPAELEYIWGDSAVQLVITVGQLLPVVQVARANLPELKHIICITERAELPDPALAGSIDGFLTFREMAQAGAELSSDPGVEAGGGIAGNLTNTEVDASQPKQEEGDLWSGLSVGENDCAVIIYTSGTTGHPKGAMLSHRNLIRNVEQIRAALHVTHKDSLLTILPLFHAFAATVCMNLPLATGACSALMESFAAGRALEMLERYRLTLFPAVPAMFNALLAHLPERDYDLSALRLFISGGAPLSASTLSALEARFGKPVLEGDGPTECSPATSVNREEGPRKVGSVGTPIPGVEIAIFDDDDRPLPTNEVGEIVVRGDNVMLGYLNQPEATQEAMRSGWYHTGDLGRIDEDGFVFIVDRKKDMIITAGLNVYPREVEELLLSHPEVADVAVIGMPDPLRGEEVVAVIVTRPDSKVDERGLIRFCRERLANYKAPRRVLFRAELPRGGTGKVVKRLLKKELELEAQTPGN